jgi:hypothetical protein
MTTPNVNPLPDSTPLDDLHPARFLKPADLLDRWKTHSIVVTVARVQMEETVPNPRDTVPDPANPSRKIARTVIQPVLYFLTKTGDEFPRGYLLSAKVDIESIKTSTGAQTTGELKSRKIRIIVGEHKHSAVLRIDASPIKDNPAPAPDREAQIKKDLGYPEK